MQEEDPLVQSMPSKPRGQLRMQNQSLHQSQAFPQQHSMRQSSI